MIEELAEKYKSIPSYQKVRQGYKREPSKLIGRGGFGVVYTAIRQFAIKGQEYQNSYEYVVLKEFKGSDKWKQNLDKDRQILLYEQFMRKVDRQYFLQVKEIFKAKRNRTIIAMEYAKGGTLLDRLKKKGLSENETLAMSLKLAKTLRYLHYELLKNYTVEGDREDRQQLGIMHRDIKPHNIVFKGENAGDAYLIDYGISKTLYTEGYNVVSNYGTSYYKPPEIAEEMRSNCKVDVFSFGLVLAEVILKGEKFYTKQTLQLKANEKRLYIKGRLYEIYERMQRTLGSWSKKQFWIYLLSKCLEYDQKNRWNSKQLVDALQTMRFQKIDISSLILRSEQYVKRIIKAKEQYELNFEIYRLCYINNKIFTLFQLLYLEQPKISKFITFAILKFIAIMFLEKYERILEKCQELKRSDRHNYLIKCTDRYAIADIKKRINLKIQKQIEKDRQLCIEKRKKIPRYQDKQYSEDMFDNHVEYVGNYEKQAIAFPEIINIEVPQPRKILYEFCYQHRIDIVNDEKYAEIICNILEFTQEFDSIASMRVTGEIPLVYHESQNDNLELISKNVDLISLEKFIKTRQELDRKCKESGNLKILQTYRVEKSVNGSNVDQNSLNLRVR